MKTIPLTQGKVALVDDADYAAVSAFKWCASKKGKGFYAAREVRRSDGEKTLQHIHQFLMPGIKRVDHKDGNGLNNQRDNLRAATHRQNGQGSRHKPVWATSKFRGVCWNTAENKWQSEIRVNGKKVYLGRFLDEESAARAYDSAAQEYFKEFASPNFLL